MEQQAQVRSHANSQSLPSPGIDPPAQHSPHLTRMTKHHMAHQPKAEYGCQHSKPSYRTPIEHQLQEVNDVCNLLPHCQESCTCHSDAHSDAYRGNVCAYISLLGKRNTCQASTSCALCHHCLRPNHDALKQDAQNDHHGHHSQ